MSNRSILDIPAQNTCHHTLASGAHVERPPAGACGRRAASSTFCAGWPPSWPSDHDAISFTPRTRELCPPFRFDSMVIRRYWHSLPAALDCSASTHAPVAAGAGLWLAPNPSATLFPPSNPPAAPPKPPAPPKPQPKPPAPPRYRHHRYRYSHSSSPVERCMANTRGDFTRLGTQDSHNTAGQEQGSRTRSNRARCAKACL